MARLNASDLGAALAPQRQTQTASRDQYGTIALDAQGNPTLLLDGGEDYAPCTCMVGVHHGDRVMAHVVNHRIVVFANITAPTTDDAIALVAIDRADAAAEAADAAGIAAASAQADATAAKADAATAKSAAQGAVADAADAKAAATQAQADAASAAQDAASAAASAQSAEENAQVAQASATAAQGSASSAQASATAAQQSASTASQAATTAQGSASTAAQAAQAAQQDASDASDAATQAQTSASNAATSASNAATSASNAAADAAQAHTEATSANLYANSALDQLGIVQDVVGVLEWASSHGTFAKTADTAIVSGKVYFTYDGADYAPVVEPDASRLSTYYELSMSEAMNDFILAHLAVTSRGLWVLPAGKGAAADEQHAAGYKLLLSTDGTYIYDGSGVQVAKYGGTGVDFNPGKSWHIGSDDAYILYTPATAGNPASIVIGGSRVQLGSSKTLAQWEAELEQAAQDAADAVQAANDVPIVTLSSTNGTVFKRNLGVTTTIVATIFTPGGRIDNAAELRRRFGSGAYLEWGWRDVVTDAEHVLVNTDPRIGNGGFTLTVDPDDIDTQAVITCSLNY